ncbi:MAG: SMP-30/gluconolactonase/LRE family protein [Acidimicrobiales bacterium]|jgi:gluconolactonase|nr:SMP-30/gluconolactonase/LRE family protein [Acidimicrobiales bacterium]MDP6297935.1 SMP-30/gluconolactonase/LRE family protein [Acidimicrobiales bacterium]HJM27954.1 SMP-30/gluconolactonase/LRE family protein [Acidimicrobiales bacterium]HJM98354.1 SMP-30/gluconolactonase/LRE family protein [Acidimicrobiales bacterium]
MAIAHTVLTDQLEFPEGPVVMDDGSIIVVEIAGPRLTRVNVDGSVETIAEWDDISSAGPNGAALGPDGHMYVCNNGGFIWSEIKGMRWPLDPVTGANQASTYVTGSIDRVNIETGEITSVYQDFEGDHLCGPNDIVFDDSGGFWFTDLGKQRRREIDKGAVYYAQPDGSSISRVIDNLDHPNGCGLSPDGKTLYVAQTTTGRLWAYDVEQPGVLKSPKGVCVANTLASLDSLAVEADGTVVVAALRDGILVARPDGSHEFQEIDGPLITNVAFSREGNNLAYITESALGSLLVVDWPRPGLELAYTA